MNLNIMWKNIKRLCEKQNITITQIEKDLGFSPGSMSKWRQSSPSIEKVIAVSDYFQVSLDNICGTSTDKKDEELQKAKDEWLSMENCSWYSDEQKRIARDTYYV